MSIRKISLLSVVCALFGVSQAEAETLPGFLASELAPLIAISSPTEINPGIYELSRENQTFSDEIACILVKTFGQSDQIQADMLEVVVGDAQRTAVVESINTCMRASDVSEVDEFDDGLAQDTAENPSNDVNSAVTPN